MSVLQQVPRGRHWDSPTVASSSLDINCNTNPMVPTPFLYGVMCSSPAYITNMLFFFAVTIAFSVIMKRRSARPGGRIYQYNQSKVHKLLSDRKRRLRDMLNDPVLERDMKRQYGDLSSLRESVAQWELDDFALQKKEDDDCVKVGGILVVLILKDKDLVYIGLIG
mmetsp:Transcript_1501/g.2731  ORF Transcript_1501/g.2731 Transcript_1501/m.2731 type:complete len:166 (-) Transcript_1501:63-560(-)|eukprot:CAMPEP_0201966292 /NCGR_PEP_ID=MMETSP0904-20121228/11337_1 /ASSEMBLY_ACC=CAM_ASM_000553 /TAXON_ID=420261 /ORGANISM="Thalassiosira antarctica, Strain CCMP982" /LENGTH=165 /DNA_ID=CAMNT_0048513523 /DNA_START=158 /DNA_END=655 /DNA_ORIENTATION=+